MLKPWSYPDEELTSQEEISYTNDNFMKYFVTQTRALMMMAK